MSIQQTDNVKELKIAPPVPLKTKRKYVGSSKRGKALIGNTTDDLGNDIGSCYSKSIADDEMSRADDAIFVKSLRYYVLFNGIRFFLITCIILSISIFRQLKLYDHYNHELCCFCYYIAYKHYSQSSTTIFEWQSCRYDYNIKNPTTTCNIPDSTYKSSHVHASLSTHYDLFGTKGYYVITAGITLLLALSYSIYTFYKSRKSSDIRNLLSSLPLPAMLLYNIIISIICFYQILIDYEYYPKYYSVGSSPTELTEGDCYIDSLNNTTEHFLLGVLITALVYTISPCFIYCILHLCCNKNKNVISIYNGIVFGTCGIVAITFFGILIYFTFDVMKHFEWNMRTLVIVIDVGLLSSFVDMYFFKIWNYSDNNPIYTVVRLLCYGCTCKCLKSKKYDSQLTYRNLVRRPSMSISVNEK